MPYTPILATLGYVFSPDGKWVLMIHRSARPADAHFRKYNGVHLAGTVSWPGFGKRGEDWFGFIFRVTRFTGTPFDENPEGTLEWVPVDRVPTLPLWEGDRFFLPLVFDPASPQFHGVMPYREGKP